MSTSKTTKTNKPKIFKHEKHRHKHSNKNKHEILESEQKQTNETKGKHGQPTEQTHEQQQNANSFETNQTN